MIKRIQKPGILAFIDYFVGPEPIDIWEFVINNDKFRLVNGWGSGAKLYKNDKLIFESRKSLHLNTKKPFIEIMADGTKISIYLRAWLSVSIKVAVNDQFMQEGYV